ncbi:type IV secretory system conjugative DNA transfer family protein [Haloplanus aerogenes]|uniref:AAA domain-containing protein n=1 Tax=Haloplanus aerogenes TaxID=660522 RepID=A0A3M0D9V1_9EURY|nr:type IV secretory system conjugative DNA transfer family protein [Haloplanus aerogenes]AZH26685.1 hypothetical protein DU502_15450 [Haloplanus aerogenes]RMB12923.1 AAA domain-containing protein [Haloplanus aerogenes]
MKVQYPAPITEFKVKFWRYTVGDLVRIILPVFIGLILAGLPGAVVGSVVGIGFAELQIHGKTLDKVLVDLLRFHTEKQQLECEYEVRDQVAVTDNGVVIGLVEIDSVDLDMASERDWQVNRDTLANLHREIEDPVEIHSRKRRVDLSDCRCVKNQAVTTDHYVVIRDSPDSPSILPWKESESRSVEARIEDTVERCRMIRNSLNAGDLSANHITRTPLEQTLNRLEISEPSLTNTRYTIGEDSHRRILCISGYPEKRGPGVLSDILNMDAPGFIDVVQNVEPASDKQRKKLGRLVGRMRAETVATPNPLRSSEIDRKLADAQDLIDIEGSGDERLVNAAAYIVIRGESWEEVDETTEEVKRLLRRFNIKHEEPWLETPRSIRTDSITRPDGLDRGMIMPSRSVAASFAFSTHDKIEEGGISFGIDTRNSMPVVLNRFTWEAGHIARMGKTGSGKTYFAILSLLRSWQTYSDLQVYIIDPKQEYGSLTEAIDGETVVLDSATLSDLETGSVTRYTVADRSQDNTDLLSEAVRHIYRKASEDRRKTIVLIDEAHRLLFDPNGRKALDGLVREGRDRNVSVEMITQNASDFTRSQAGQNILRNVDCYLFMKHQDVETGVSDFFNLSPKQAVELRRLRTGTDLPFSEAIIRGPVSTKLRIESTQSEHDLITREFEENLISMPENTATEARGKQTNDPDNPVKSDGGTEIKNPDADTGNLNTQSQARNREVRGSEDGLLELPDTCITEAEDPDREASAEELLPEVLPGWKKLGTTTDRWAVPVAEDWVLGTYLGPKNDRYLIHISRWQPDHVQYAVDELFGVGEPVRFDAWTARGRFIFGVVILDGSIDRARTLLTACPALSERYIQLQE